ncbi:MULTISPECIES: sensor histidine kinase [Chryseobacterium]|uniref:sensor histidine kinase n=1 Tax=Chryseobacterium TaxID=59732 RepID=UPI00195C4C6F|nr:MULTISPECIES: HAMP domain-containing sensor histidine kinase [Chryseobacterium]MBM7417510.1 signal transduction histidine kinase [Chryseobacterium sp. JUb44]MDH6211702.1 two-component system sensor histidine kinase QseC [Chryseobacterium sp. BIGb0186]WSO10345.1 HAMP domain-containing sensor histidine kinase [Chryseobacterium scophthalmum]
MKLLNKSILHLMIYLLLIVSLWSVIFYFNMLDEIKGSVDEELENYKRQIVFKAEKDSTILQQKTFDEGFFSVNKISEEEALSFKDTYEDTEIYAQDADDEAPELEPVRILTTVFEQNGNFYQLKIFNNMVEEDDLVKELLWDAAGLYVLLIFSILMINNIVLQRLWKPFYELLDELKNYRLGISKSFPNTETKTKEFSDLQDAVTTLLQYSEKSYEQQKEFIGNASHELQTPLAIAISKLELLIEKENFTENQAEKIAEIMEIIERLVRLNKSLLLLTKIENKQFFDNQEIKVNDIVEKNIEDLSDIAEFKEVEIIFSENSELLVKADAALINIIVSNLLRNAIFHNIKSGKVEVKIDAKKLNVLNTGTDHSLSHEKIFTRFQKSEQHQSGSGLGLAIVKAIAELYDFSVSYDFKNGMHEFSVNF